MAKNKKQQVKQDEPIALDVQLSKGEAFIEKNWKKIATVLGVISSSIFDSSMVPSVRLTSQAFFSLIRTAGFWNNSTPP